MEKAEDRKLIADLCFLKAVAEKARMTKIVQHCYDGSLADEEVSSS